MPNTSLNITYDFGQKEIRIEFETPQQAKAYQGHNPEARILRAANKSVWLPVPPQLKSLRSSSRYGIEFCFANEQAQKEWQRKTLLAELVIPHGTTRHSVHLKKEWTQADLNNRLGI
ncbi:hypothetical protein F4818DRAFT_439297 [Hypoxylon cercidicola]|nr:hypothetical protein F4818DRAFT_439297 [Hypoxylon cercidicola]